MEAHARHLKGQLVSVRERKIDTFTAGEQNLNLQAIDGQQIYAVNPKI